MAELRAVLAAFLHEQMVKDDKVVVIDADLAKADGTWALRKDFPERAFDVGIAEADMTSIAAGLSSYGYKPYITSFTPFVTRRNCDQVAISVCYAKQNVKIVGTDPGISAELNGGTHMSMEDVSVMRGIPGMVIFEPVDETQLKAALPVINDYYGAVYIRLFRKVIADVFDPATYKFDLFKADKIKDGKDVTLFVSGIMTQEALLAEKILAEKGVDAEIINIHTIKPIDVKIVAESVKKTGCAVVAENHNVVGGLYSAVCEALAQEYPVPVLPIGVPDCFGEVGKMPYLKEKYGMRAEDIAEKCLLAISKKK